MPFSRAGWRASWPHSSCSACREPASRVVRPTRPGTQARRPARVRSRLRQGRRSPQVRTIQRTCRGRAGSPARWTGCTDRGREAAVTRFQVSRASRRSTESSGPQTRQSADARAEGVAPAGSRLRAARGFATGACAPGQVAQARAEARPGGRSVRAAHPGRGPAASAPQRGARQRRGHRPYGKAAGSHRARRRSSVRQPRPRPSRRASRKASRAAARSATANPRARSGRHRRPAAARMTWACRS